MKNFNETGNLTNWLGERASLPVVDKLHRSIFKEMNNRPFVYEDAKIKEETSNWDADFFDAKIGEVEVGIYVSATGTFPGGKGPYDPKKYRLVKMSLSECLKRMKGEVDDFYLVKGEKYYLYGTPEDLLSKLSSTIDLKPFIPEGHVDQNFWLSSPGNITPIHYDLNDNFLMQLIGLKKVLLWNPASYDGLKFHPIGHAHDRQSRIDHKNLDEKAFEELSKLETYSHDLTPGQILHIPFGWGHFVYTETFAVSVNYWWDPGFVTSLYKSLQIPNPGKQLFDIVDELVVEMRPELSTMIKGMQKDGSLNALLQS